MSLLKLDESNSHEKDSLHMKILLENLKSFEYFKMTLATYLVIHVVITYDLENGPNQQFHSCSEVDIGVSEILMKMERNQHIDYIFIQTIVSVSS